MNKRIKARWVKALRSGKYKQGINKLKTHDGKYCCLGVLTDLYCKSKKRAWASVHNGGDETLPVRVQKWAGVDGDNPEVLGECISEYNDGGGNAPKKSFRGIATLIEKHL